MRDLLLGTGSNQAQLEQINCKEAYSFIKILKAIETVQSQRGEPVLKRLTFPSTLIVDHTAAKTKITWVVSSALGGKLEFLHNPPENKIMSRFGRMNDPTGEAVVVKCLIDESTMT